LIASIGIVLFNYFKNNEKDSDESLTIIGIIFLIVSLLGDGILPDLQAEIKSQYKPSAIEMYYHINRSTAVIGIVYATISFELLYISNFVMSHEQILADIALYSILNAIGQLVIYQMIKLFKQHIPSFIIATRKCFTVIVNIMYFGHKINLMQISGILFVFFAVMMEVY
jgi:UDP-galactose transporter B1